MPTLYEVKMQQGRISAEPMITYNADRCVVAVVFNKNKCLLAHIVPGGDYSDLELFFERDKIFLQRDLFDQEIRKGFVFGGNSQMVEMIETYLRNISVDILVSKKEEDVRDVFVFPKEKRVYESQNGKALEYKVE